MREIDRNTNSNVECFVHLFLASFDRRVVGKDRVGPVWWTINLRLEGILSAVEKQRFSCKLSAWFD